MELVSQFQSRGREIITVRELLKMSEQKLESVKIEYVVPN
jgi:hypothetical protein